MPISTILWKPARPTIKVAWPPSLKRSWSKGSSPVPPQSSSKLVWPTNQHLKSSDNPPSTLVEAIDLAKASLMEMPRLAWDFFSKMMPLRDLDSKRRDISIDQLANYGYTSIIDVSLYFFLSLSSLFLFFFLRWLFLTWSFLFALSTVYHVLLTAP